MAHYFAGHRLGPVIPAQAGIQENTVERPGMWVMQWLYIAKRVVSNRET